MMKAHGIYQPSREISNVNRSKGETSPAANNSSKKRKLDQFAENNGSGVDDDEPSGKIKDEQTQLHVPIAPIKNENPYAASEANNYPWFHRQSPATQAMTEEATIKELFNACPFQPVNEDNRADRANQSMEANNVADDENDDDDTGGHITVGIGNDVFILD